VDDAAGLADDDLLVALCAPEGPCGRAAEELLTAAGIDVEADSLELSVRGVVTRLGLREVDAGIVYRTDVAGSDGTLRAIATDAADTVGLVRYVAAPLEARPGGAELVEFLLGAEAQGILAEHGFGAP
jgi:molybdate transport system substrate-binding protein